MALLLALLACRTATVVDACVEHPDLCPACASEDDCVLGGNPCLETALCAHRDAEIAVIEIGCSEALEYDWPPPETCGCVEGICRSRE